MFRMISCLGALMALCAAVVPASADDRATCDSAGAGDSGIAACSRWLKGHPNDSAAYYNRGDFYYSKKEYDRAIADFDQAIRLNPKDAQAYNSRGNAYNDKGEYDRAIADHDQAIRLAPKKALPYYGRGHAYNEKGDHDRAIADFDQAIRLDPNYAQPYNGRGMAYNNKGDYDRAIPDFDQAIQRAPKKANPFSHRGYAYGRKGDFDRAITDLNKAITLDPKYARGLSNRAAIYELRGDAVRAAVDVDEAIRLDPKDAFAYNIRGEVYLDNGQYALAIADFDKALRLTPNFTEAHQNRDRAQASLAAARPEPQAALPQPAVVPSPPAAPSRRVALVIGMSAYANVPPLANPASDARAVADAFRRLGFVEVIERENLTRAKMEEVLKEFGDKAAAADWAVIYYAGHGVEMNGVNYLIPVDAKLARADHVEDETVSLTRVLSKAELARKLRMVILDACRNNPFRLASAEGRPRAVGRGLSPIEPVGGVLVAYAARGGTMADDGGAGHSPFTQALLTHLETPGLDIGLMFRKVRDSVLARTNNVQEPFTYGSLPGEEFYFKQAGR